MTKLLEKAFAAAAKLPEPAQNRIAANLLQEPADDAKWDASFARSASLLERMAGEALAEFQAGRTEELRFDEPCGLISSSVQLLPAEGLRSAHDLSRSVVRPASDDCD